MKLHLAVVAAGVMFAQGAGATTVSISGEQFTGTPPVEEVPFPTMTSGSFSHFETTSIPGVETSPYGVGSSIPYSVLDKGGGIPSSATYSIVRPTA